MINLMQGDCLELMKQIPDQSIDMILCDPPYGTTACSWDVVIPFDKMWEQLNRVIKNNGAIVLFGSEPFSSSLRISNIKNFKYDWVWEKSKASGFLNCNKKPLLAHEIISVFYKKLGIYNPQGIISVNVVQKKKVSERMNGTGLGSYGRNKIDHIQKIGNYPRSVLKYKKPKGQFHPNEKPTALLEYLIKTYTKEDSDVGGRIVLDFTMGSGSTGVACVNTNRNFIGIELDKNYFESAKKRIEEAVKEKEMQIF